MPTGTRWPSGTVNGAELATVRSWARIPPVAAVYKRQLSVPSIRGPLMSTSDSWGVNGHTTRYTSVVLRLRLVSGWGLRKRRSAPPRGLKAREKTLLFTIGDCYLCRTVLLLCIWPHKRTMLKLWLTFLQTAPVKTSPQRYALLLFCAVNLQFNTSIGL